MLQGLRSAYTHDAEQFINPFLKVLQIDAIADCQDRHSKNWGIIRSDRAIRDHAVLRQRGLKESDKFELLAILGRETVNNPFSLAPAR